MNTVIGIGDSIDLSIHAVAHGGDGIGHLSGQVCFVSGALPGDRVEAQIYRKGKRALWARTTTILEKSPARLASTPCLSAACTSACGWHDFSYPEQARWKQRIVADALKRIGKIDADVAWKECPDLRSGYRTRAAFHNNGKVTGYYSRQSHDVIPVADCPLHHPHLNAALKGLQGIPWKGDIQVTVNPEASEVLVWTKDPCPPLAEAFPLYNCARDDTRHQFLFDGVPIVNGVFSQSSLLLNRLLVKEVNDSLGEAESLLDLYCGSGNFSINHAGKIDVLGIDHSSPAIRAAADSCRGSYRQGDESVMIAQLHQRPWDAVLLDPPRTGARQLTDALSKTDAQKIIYVSCDPATLARDLQAILTGHWQLSRVTAVDMFPHTPHIETIALLQREIR